MKENVLDVLMYLFEHYMDEDTGLRQDEEELKVELAQAGFQHAEIAKAFAWLDGLSALQGRVPEGLGVQASPAIRVYTSQEVEKLDLECRGFLLFLEQVGVVDAETRELIIDRVMALESEETDVDHLKWVVLMVLFNQPGQEAAYAWIEDMVLDEMGGNLH